MVTGRVEIAFVQSHKLRFQIKKTAHHEVDGFETVGTILRLGRLVLVDLKVWSADERCRGEVLAQTKRHRTVFKCVTLVLNTKNVVMADFDVLKLEVAKHVG